jgi:outer membrane protein TolC
MSGMLLSALAVSKASAQEVKPLTLSEAINLGIQNSTTLKLSQARVDEAVSRYNQAKDNILPKASASYAYNHAEIPTTTLQIGPGTPLHLPKRADAFIGTLSVQEMIFAGNKFKYAKESTDLLARAARLDAERDKDEIVYTIVNAYYNLYKINQTKKVVEQNLEAIDNQLKQAQRFFDQGIVTKNDVLRFQLQRSNSELTGIDLENNRKIVNYNLDVLLGLPENTQIQVNEFADSPQYAGPLSAYIDSALSNRQEIRSAGLRTQLAVNNINTIKADIKPTIGVGANMYYINPSGKFIPPANSFIAPISVGATIAWNFDRFWMNKNKLAEANIQRSEAELGRTISSDAVKTEVNQNYQNYLTALQRIKVYQTSIAQAAENDKILESKYKNNVASVTDRIDAQTQLFQTQVNLEIAKADAGLAYYSLLKSTGSILTAQ